MSNRSEQLGEEIQKQLGTIIQADFPDAIITVHDVVLSKDLSIASVWIKMLGRDVFGTILENQNRYRYLLGQKIHVKYLPDLKFVKI